MFLIATASPSEDAGSTPAQETVPIGSVIASARKTHIRPAQMRTEELAALMRGFDPETVRRFSDFKKK
jgi:hypothetical protein